MLFNNLRLRFIVKAGNFPDLKGKHIDDRYVIGLTCTDYADDKVIYVLLSKTKLKPILKALTTKGDDYNNKLNIVNREGMRFLSYDLPIISDVAVTKSYIKCNISEDVDVYNLSSMMLGAIELEWDKKLLRRKLKCLSTGESKHIPLWHRYEKEVRKKGAYVISAVVSLNGKRTMTMFSRENPYSTIIEKLPEDRPYVLIDVERDLQKVSTPVYKPEAPLPPDSPQSGMPAIAGSQTETEEPITEEAISNYAQSGAASI